MARDDWKGRTGGASGEGAPTPAPAPAKRGDWRGGRSAAGQGAGAKAATGWAAHKSLAGEKLVWKFRAKVAAWAAAGLVLFGVLVWMLWTPKTTPFISLALTQYKFPLPPNAWAYDDIQNIRDQLTQQGPAATRDEPLTTSEERRIEWEPDTATWLEKLRVQVRNAANIRWYHRESCGPGSGVVIVYLSGHGVMDTNGNPCLLLPQRTEEDDLFDPQKSNELSRDRLLPIETLLTTVFPVKGEGRLPDGVTKLVILDANRIDAAWELGILYNDFCEGLKRFVENHDVANLYVLNSCGAGQIGWSAPELGGSAFGFFVKRGLAGFADGCLGGNRDQSVSLAELHQFTVHEVGKWVANFRGDVQRPELVMTKESNPDKLVVEYAEKMTSRPEPNFADSRHERRINEIEQRLADIRKQGWDRYGNESFARQAVRRRPLLWQRYTAKLLRLEALAMAGEGYRDQYQAELTDLEQLRSKLDQTPTEASPPNGLQLAKALAAPVSPDPALEKSLRAKLDGDPKAAPTPRTTQNYLPRADTAWRWILENAKDGAKLRDRIDNVVKQTLPADGPDWNIDFEPVEIHFLRMLHAHLDQRGAAPGLWEMVGKAIVRRQRAEQLATPGDFRVQYPLRPVASEADDLRRLTEDLLFLGGEKLTEAQQRGQAADERLAQAAELARTLSDALALRDRVLDEIPDMVRYYARRPTAESVGGEAGEENEIPQLLAIRDQVVARLAEIDELKPEAVGRYDAQIKSLRNDFESRRKMLLNRMGQFRAGSDNLDRRRIYDRLPSPIATGETRKRLHDNWRELAMDYKFVEDTATQKEAAEPTGTPASLARALRWVQAWKEHPALRLAEVTGRPTAESPAVTIDSLRADGGRLREQLARLAKEIAQWRRPNGDLGLYAEGRAPPSRDGLAQADRRVRAVAALLAASATGRPEPAESLELFDRQRLLVWHCERTLADFWGPPPGAMGDSFFQVAAKRCIELARRQLSPQNEAPLTARLAERARAAQDGISAAFDPQFAQLRVDSAGPKDEAHQVNLTQRAGRDFPAGVATYYLAGNRPESRRAQVATKPPGIGYAVHPADDPSASKETKSYLIQNVGELLGNDSRRELRGVVLYRGHEFKRPPAIVELTRFECKRQFKYEEPKYPEAQLIVQGRERPRALVVVFDCSSSMGDTFPGLSTRFQAARKVLKDVLAELAEAAPETQLSLRLYGHRSAYQRVAGREDIRAPVELSPFARSDFAKRLGGGEVQQAADTQRVVDLKDIAAAKKEIEGDVLPLLSPHGSTQLYLSIKEAVEEDFKTLKGGKEYDRHVVVITDGFNYQRADDPKVPRDKVVRHNDLLAALKRERAKAEADKLKLSIDVICLDAEDQTAQDGIYVIGSRQELTRVVKEAGGNLDLFSSQRSGTGEAADPYQRLLRTIRSRFGVLNFEITDQNTSRPAAVRRRDVPRDGDAGEQGGSRFSLNQSIAFSGLTSHVARNFRLEFDAVVRGQDPPVQTLDFQLRGRGERIVMKIRDRALVQYFGPNGRLPDQLDWYDLKNQDLTGEIEGPTPGQKLLLIPAKPQWRRDPVTQQEGVRFKIYVREGDLRRVTPQPIEAIALVDAQVEDPQFKEPPMLIHDVTFEPDQPCPTLSFIVPKFPRARVAARAKIWLWLKYQPTTPSLEFTPQDGPREMKLDDAAVRFTSEVDGRGDELWIKVVETHADPAKTLSPRERLHLSVKFDRPQRVTRCYVSDDRTLIHHFYYSTKDKADLSVDKLTRTKLQVVEVARMQQGAVTMLPNTPIHVGIPVGNE